MFNNFSNYCNTKEWCHKKNFEERNETDLRDLQETS
jgi:hypothetical protein